MVIRQVLFEKFQIKATTYQINDNGNRICTRGGRKGGEGKKKREARRKDRVGDREKGGS